MKKVEIKILKNGQIGDTWFGGWQAFNNVTVDKVYPSFIVFTGDPVPKGWASYEGQKNDFPDTVILFVNDLDEYCAVGFENTLNIYFEILEETK